MVQLKLVGKIRGVTGTVETLAAMEAARQLGLVADREQLWADGSDWTRLSVHMCDGNGRTLPYAHHCVTFSVTGPAVLVGEKPVSLEVGRAAVFVRSTHKTGSVGITAASAGAASAGAQIQCVPSTQPTVPLPQGAVGH